MSLHTEYRAAAEKRIAELEEQNETLLRVVNAAVRYCADLNNLGEADTDDLEAEIAALYPASGVTGGGLRRPTRAPEESFPASEPDS